MKTKNLILGGIIVAIIIAIVATFLYFSDQPTTLKLGYVDLPHALPVFVAQEQGLFEKHGLNVTTVGFRSSDPEIEALVSGQIDIAFDLSSSVLFAAEQRTPGSFRIFQVQSSSENNPFTYVLVAKDSSLNSLEELKGKKVGIFPSSTADVLGSLAFENALGSDNGITLVQVSPLNWGEALSTGSVDGLISYEPLGTLLITNDLARVIHTGLWEKYVMQDIPASTGVYATEFQEENPELVKKFNAAIREAIDYIIQNEKDSRTLLPKYSKLVTDEQVALSTPLPTWEDIDSNNVARLQDFADILYNEGDLQNKIDIASMLYRP